MYTRNVLLFASAILPIICAPIATNEVPSIEERSAVVLSPSRSYVPKREATVDVITTKRVEDIVFETKRGADIVEVRNVESEEPSDDEDAGEVDPTKRGLRGNSGAGGGKRDTPETVVAARGVRQGNGNNHKARGVRLGTGNNPRGVRGKTGNNPRGVRGKTGNNPRGVRGKTGNNPRGVRQKTGNNPRGVRGKTGNNPRGVRQGNGNNHKTRDTRGSGANSGSSLVQRALEALFL